MPANLAAGQRRSVRREGELSEVPPLGQKSLHSPPVGKFEVALTRLHCATIVRPVAKTKRKIFLDGNDARIQDPQIQGLVGDPEPALTKGAPDVVPAHKERVVPQMRLHLPLIDVGP